MKFTRLTELRKQKKVSMEKMAELVGLNKHTYTSYETGFREPRLSSLIKLADYFGVSTDYIINHSDAKKVLTSDITDEEIELLQQYRLLKPEIQHFISESIRLAASQQAPPSPALTDNTTAHQNKSNDEIDS